jgi:uncharacterized protein YjbJ (UPF0337 family)
MKPSTNDQIDGKLHEIKGAMKQMAGEITNNPDLAVEGQAEKLVGTVQQKAGQLRKSWGQ